MQVHKTFLIVMVVWLCGGSAEPMVPRQDDDSQWDSQDRKRLRWYSGPLFYPAASMIEGRHYGSRYHKDDEAVFHKNIRLLDRLTALDQLKEEYVSLLGDPALMNLFEKSMRYGTIHSIIQQPTEETVLSFDAFVQNNVSVPLYFLEVILWFFGQLNSTIQKWKDPQAYRYEEMLINSEERNQEQVRVQRVIQEQQKVG